MLQLHFATSPSMQRFNPDTRRGVKQAYERAGSAANNLHPSRTNNTTTATVATTTSTTSRSNYLQLLKHKNSAINNFNNDNNHRLKIDYSSFRLIIKSHDAHWSESLNAQADDWLALNNSKFKCLKISQSEKRADMRSSTYIMTQANTRCTSSFRCLKFHKEETDDVVLMQIALNDYICRLLSKASIPVLKEPSGISAHDGRRPDGCPLIPWRAGRCLAWDVTVPGTLAERYENLTSKKCGLATARAADEKMKKYWNALPSMEFLLICIEVLGPMDPNTLKFLKAICKMISVRSGDSRELFFATNHISCLLQRFLRVCVLENIQLNADMCN
ncbi:hypothetical protein HELRODRAFT_184010 [Helobdella robusta]|uniref:Uncharacterized protein n=1 Tax=Helobdella robusta TaxID=6412 RepID=T1FKF1_HELRO|nr:hypothetical protein HELRODRAFT_184010 [Helobdella robusta]ESO09620.1 hypothetical protein HELRODRAFT_184010 [Helobdella robusta]